MKIDIKQTLIAICIKKNAGTNKIKATCPKLNALKHTTTRHDVATKMNPNIPQASNVTNVVLWFTIVSSEAD